MLDQQTLMSIIGALEEAKSMIEQLGASGDEMAVGGMDLGVESGDELQSWNARDVSVPPPNKPAFLVDKSQFIKGGQPVAQEQYMEEGMAEPEDDVLNYMPID